MDLGSIKLKRNYNIELIKYAVYCEIWETRGWSQGWSNGVGGIIWCWCGTSVPNSGISGWLSYGI